MDAVAVAFSGGIDSTVVAKAAFLALGDKSVAVTADSPSVARSELDEAVQVAKLIGIRHEIVRTRQRGQSGPLDIGAEYMVHSYGGGDRMYIVVEGEARITHRRAGRSIGLGIIRPGDFFGEIGALTGSLRTADVVADVEVAVVDPDRSPGPEWSPDQALP